MQFAILAQSPREMSQTDRIVPRYFLSRVRISIRPRYFLNAKKLKTTVAARSPTGQRHRPSERRNNLNGSLHRCQPSRNRAGNPANLLISRIPAFFPKHPAFLGFFGGEKNRRKSPSFVQPKRHFVGNSSFTIKDFRLYDGHSS